MVCHRAASIRSAGTNRRDQNECANKSWVFVSFYQASIKYCKVRYHGYGKNAYSLCAGRFNQPIANVTVPAASGAVRP